MADRQISINCKKHNGCYKTKKVYSDFTNGFVNELNNPWFNYFIKFNPADYLTKINCPVLALNGEKDIQVAAKPNLTGITKCIGKK